MESLQGESPCELNANPTKRLSFLVSSGITIDWSCLAPTTNIVEEVDNVGESDSVEEVKRSIDHHETHEMPPAGIINRSQLLQEVLPIHTLT
jgi:hypothetical protein